MGQPRRFIQPYAVRCAEYGSPKDVCVVIPGSQEYVTLHGRRDFAGVIKLRILYRGVILNYWSRITVIRSLLIHDREAGESERRKCNSGGRGQNHVITGRGPWYREWRELLEARRGKEADSALELPEDIAYCLSLGCSKKITIDWVTWTRNTDLSHLGGCKPEIRLTPCLGESPLPGCRQSNFPCNITWQKELVSSVTSSCKGANPVHDLITSQRSHLQF